MTTWKHQTSSDYTWAKAWWFENETVRRPALRINDNNAYIMTHRTRPGYFICPWVPYVGYDFDYMPPFETLELAQLAYEMMI